MKIYIEQNRIEKKNNEKIDDIIISCAQSDNSSLAKFLEKFLRVWRLNLDPRKHDIFDLVKLSIDRITQIKIIYNQDIYKIKIRITKKPIHKFQKAYDNVVELYKTEHYCDAIKKMHETFKTELEKEHEYKIKKISNNLPLSKEINDVIEAIKTLRNTFTHDASNLDEYSEYQKKAICKIIIEQMFIIRDYLIIMKGEKNGKECN